MNVILLTLSGCTLLTALVGCGATVKMKYVDAAGTHGSGAITVDGTMHDGKLSMKDGAQTCAGSFDNWSNLTLVVPVKCSDGLTGTATLSRNLNGPISGQGTMQFSDGTSRQFLFNSVGLP